jgi:hypothetical protein
LIVEHNLNLIDGDRTLRRRGTRDRQLAGRTVEAQAR